MKKMIAIEKDFILNVIEAILKQLYSNNTINAMTLLEQLQDCLENTK